MDYKIDKTNYYKATIGTFEVFKELEHVEALKGNETGKLKEAIKKFLRENKEWRMEHSSYSKITGRISSMYLINKDETKIIRVSNHWGGGVASCNWQIGDSFNLLCLRTKWQAGIIDFKNFGFDVENYKEYNF